MLFTEYDEEAVIQMFKDEAYEDGYAQGTEHGRAQGIEHGRAQGITHSIQLLAEDYVKNDPMMTPEAAYQKAEALLRQ